MVMDDKDESLLDILKINKDPNHIIDFGKIRGSCEHFLFKEKLNSF